MMSFIGDCIWKLVEITLDEAKVAGAEAIKQQLEQVRFNDALPKNEHIRYAIADSHVRALRRLVERFEAELRRQKSLQHADRMHSHEIAHGNAFCRSVRKVIRSNLFVFLDPATVETNFSDEQYEKVFTELLGTSFLDEREENNDSWIRDAAWNQLLHCLGLSNDDVPQMFREMFESPDRGFMSNFAHCFRDKLKDPENTQVFQITTALSLAQIREMQHTHWAAIETVLEELRTMYDRLANGLIGARQEQVLARPRLPRLKAYDDHPSSAFRYDRAHDDLVGREMELRAMEADFLAPFEPADVESADRADIFRWHALCGDAGSGKSRFAMELVERVADSWPIGGFLNLGATTDLSWLGFLDEPCFIVIDYAGGRAGVADLLRAFANLARCEKLQHPVRVLLLERRRDDPLFTRLFDIEAIRDWGPRSQDEIVELGQIDDASIVRLMRGRLEDRPDAFTNAQLLEHLTDFDKRKRPLFAAIVAAFLDTESLPEIDRDASAEQARWKLFEELIRKWRRSIWAGVGAQKEEMTREEDVEPYERLAALVTFIKGLASKDHLLLSQAGKLGDLPPARNPTFEYLRRILGPLPDLGKGNYLYPAMEPDLTGECFVLGQWMKSKRDGLCFKDLGKEQAAVMADIAWRVAPWKAADFARRCYQSYPNSAAAVDYLIPSAVPPEALLPKAIAIASIIAEYVTRHRAKVDGQRDIRHEAPSIIEQQGILELHALFDARIVGAAKTNIEIARTLALSTRQVINFIARAIDEKIGWADTSFAEKLEAIAEGRMEHAQTNRSAFNTGATGGKHVLH